MVKKIINALKFYFSEPCCAVGFIDILEVTNRISIPKVNWVKRTPSDRWYADPFILSVTDSTVELLVERYKYDEGKGVLSNLLINRKNNHLIRESVILELTTHLSFPFIIEESGVIYVMPENYQSGRLSIYEYDRGHNSLINPHVLVNEPLVDAVCKKIDENYYIFATKYDDNFYEAAKILYIYRSTSLKGKYVLIQTIPYEKAEGRGAGEIIEFDGNLFRPSQDCNDGYGKCVIFSKLNLKDGTFQVAEQGRILPSDIKYSLGLHTYNQKSEVVVVDGIGYRRGVLSAIISYIYKAINKIK